MLYTAIYLESAKEVLKQNIVDDQYSLLEEEDMRRWAGAGAVVLGGGGGGSSDGRGGGGGWSRDEGAGGGGGGGGGRVDPLCFPSHSQEQALCLPLPPAVQNPVERKGKSAVDFVV